LKLKMIKKFLVVYSLVGGWLILFFLLWGRELVLRNDFHDALHLIFVTNWAVLEATSAVYTDPSVCWACKQYWWRFHELHDCLGCRNSLARNSIRVFPFKHWSKRIPLQIPDLDTTVISDRSEDWGSIWWPTDIVDLLLKVADLMADKLAFTVFLVPDSHSPIIRAS